MVISLNMKQDQQTRRISIFKLSAVIIATLIVERVPPNGLMVLGGAVSSEISFPKYLSVILRLKPIT